MNSSSSSPLGPWVLPSLLTLAFVIVASSATALGQDQPDEGTSTPPVTAPEQPPPSRGTDPSIPEGPRTPPRGSAREAMWPAASTEEWKLPVLITFQRTWEDAVAVSKETEKAILVCINMDGEIASEHYAGIRYRQPEIAPLYEPYVCVIASVYRHNPTDYDDRGRRIICPRFGSVTCGEHIAIEPLLFEKFMDGRRIAPRHIMVELDGSETYDVFYANDTASVFDKITEGIATRTTEPKDIVRGDRPVTERVASRDVGDRKAVEAAYQNGDAAMRQAILDAARKHPEAAPIDLLRLAIFGLDVDMAKTARTGLAKVGSTSATDLIADALGAPMSQAERDELIAALERLGESSRKAKWLAGVHKGLGGGSATLDSEAWSRALQNSVAKAPASYERFALQYARDDRAREAKARPTDPAARIGLAEATLELARTAPSLSTENAKTAKAFERLMYHDARAAALEAQKLGMDDWRVSAVLAVVDYNTDAVATAYEHAEKAMKTMPPGETGWNAMAVLTIFGESRFKAIKNAIKAKEQWSPEWLTDLHAAYSVLLQHPLGNDRQVIWYYDFLDWLRARGRAARYLDAAISRFPGSPGLHQRLRMRFLRRGGAVALEMKYGELLEQHEQTSSLLWYAGYASVVAADSARRTGGDKAAFASYDRALGYYDKALAADAGLKDSVDHEVALALAGRARVHYQVGDDDSSLADILASFERNPESAGTRDGVGINPAETAQMLLARLREEKRMVEIALLEGAMTHLDPEHLLPDRP